MVDPYENDAILLPLTNRGHMLAMPIWKLFIQLDGNATTTHAFHLMTLMPALILVFFVSFSVVPRGLLVLFPIRSSVGLERPQNCNFRVHAQERDTLHLFRWCGKQSGTIGEIFNM